MHLERIDYATLLGGVKAAVEKHGGAYVKTSRAEWNKILFPTAHVSDQWMKEAEEAAGVVRGSRKGWSFEDRLRILDLIRGMDKSIVTVDSYKEELGNCGEDDVPEGLVEACCRYLKRTLVRGGLGIYVFQEGRRRVAVAARSLEEGERLSGLLNLVDFTMKLEL